jgi:predicted O-linked N-acetylglucosamine transferase (SPINDLY family)
MNAAPRPPSPIDHGMALHRQGRLAEAEAVYLGMLARDPACFEAQYLLAHLKYQQGQASAALAALSRALVLNPHSPEAWSLQSGVMLALNRMDEALIACERTLALRPSDAEARHNCGVILTRLGRREEALAQFDRALALRPDFTAAHFNRANLLAELSRYDDALAGYDRLLAMAPIHLDAINNRANVLSALGRTTEALVAFERVLTVNPNHLNALNNRGILLKEVGRLPEALATFSQALSINPDYVDALYNRGNTYLFLRHFEEARVDLERTLTIDSTHAQAVNALAEALASVCDWPRLNALLASLLRAAREGTIEPFFLLGLDLDPADLFQFTKTYVQRKLPAQPEATSMRGGARSERIRLAYLSSDLREHPIGYLTARLFELHDRSRVETIAISLCADDHSRIRKRLVSAFDQFHDMRAKSDRDIARLISELGVDIVIDLNGHTIGARPGMLALRPAPIQVNYLGYPGTMGADYIDYIIADRLIVPPDQQRFYSEKVVYLPDTYQANDSERVISDLALTRAQAGLPEHGFVFCSFNNTFKLNPLIFDVWMRLLREVEESVLWLLEANTSVPDNLRREAEKRGVAADRLVFAPWMKPEDHLARHRLADLFLDTLPYNAHTTASDALWAGLPVVTCLGATFAGRVAGSLLSAIGMPELITSSLEDYEALALRLARESTALLAAKQKLAASRDSAPLFDTRRFTRHIEAAYVEMWDRQRRGQGPGSFAVDPTL